MKVLSLEQMNKLKELGVDVKPKGMCLMYTSDSSDDYYLKYGESTCEDDVAAFGLQDIVELLPVYIDKYGLVIDVSAEIIGYEHYSGDFAERISFYKKDQTFINAAYEMLIWVIENGHLKTK